MRETTGANHAVGRSAKKAIPAPVVGYITLMAYNLAVQAQPNALDKDVFTSHYLRGCSNIKAEAARLGVSRRHYYRLLDAFLARTNQAAQQIALSMH